MGKVSKKKSRRDNRGSRRNNEEMETNRKQSTESSSTILTNLNSIDVKKRMSGLAMFKDLLYQNLKSTSAVDKLTSVEVLSSLSIRIIDSNNEIRFETIKCFLAIVRCGQKFAEKIADTGVLQNLLNILDEMCSMDISLNVKGNNDVINDLLSIIKVMNLHSLVHSNNTESLLLLAVRNLTSSSESRRIIFAEYLLNISTKISITSHSLHWSKIGTEILNILSSNSKKSENLSVLLSSIMINLYIYHPSTINNDIITILKILINNLNLLPIQDQNSNKSNIILNELNFSNNSVNFNNENEINENGSEMVTDIQDLSNNSTTFGIDQKSLILKVCIT